MPFLAPLIGIIVSTVASAAGAIAGLTLGGFAVGEFILSTGISIAIQEVSSLFASSPSQGMPFTTTQAASARQVIYGERRVSGVIVYMSTTGHFLNQIIIWAGHPCEAIQGVYLDGRLLHPAITGYDDGGTYYDSAGNPYSFGDVVVLWNKPAGGWISQLHDVDSNWISDAKLTNLCASYIRCAYNADKFAGIPQAKATVLGKNDIYDPRTGLYGYTNNWALIIADHLCNKEWGVGCDYTKEIDETQLIAAANICDEQVLLANGLYESRYTINGAFDTARTPGDVLDTMLLAAEGKLSYSGGKWGIYPAAWRPAAFSFAADDLAGPIQWSEKRKYRDLCNAVRATYVSPVYPYSVVGTSQDTRDSTIFSGEWQFTDAPEYAQDVGHGYSSDQNLTDDGGIKLYNDRRYEFVTSCATAQRLMKIYLLRSRQQGSGTLEMKLSAFQVKAVDTIQLSFSLMTWVNKNLEVRSFRFVPKIAQGDNGSAEPEVHCQLDVIETDASVYAWAVSEERTPQNATSPSIGRDWIVGDPSSLALSSSSTTAVIGADGIATPRILATWTEPDDPFVTSGGHIEVQFQKNGATDWTPFGMFAGAIQSCYISGVVSGQQYNVRIRSLRANGAAGNWIAVGPHTVATTLSAITTSTVLNGQGSINPASISASATIFGQIASGAPVARVTVVSGTIYMSDGSTISVPGTVTDYTSWNGSTVAYSTNYNGNIVWKVSTAAIVVQQYTGTSTAQTRHDAFSDGNIPINYGSTSPLRTLVVVAAAAVAAAGVSMVRSKC
jgi:hypothetical protein